MLPDSQRFLLNGTYRPPRTRVGRFLTCRLRGRVVVSGISDTPIQWPVTRLKNGCLTPILCGDLVRAVTVESNLAVAHYWGVSPSVVSGWRKAVGVPPTNQGTHNLRSAWWNEGGVGEASRPARMKSLASPERAAKISASRQGKARPAHVMDALRKANLGRKASRKTRKKMSEAAKARGLCGGRAFTPDEDALLGAKPDAEVAELLGRDPSTIAGRRHLLGIASWRKKEKGW